MEQKIVVEIFGESYPLKTDQDPEYLRKLAALVDSEMRAAAQQTTTFSGARVGAMAALKIADEYFQLKKDYDELVAMVECGRGKARPSGE